MYPYEKHSKKAKIYHRFYLLQQIKAYHFSKLNEDLIKIFIDEIYSKPPKKNYETNKKLYNHIDEIWSFDLADMTDWKISNNKGYRYIFNIIDSFSKNTCAVTWKNKNSKKFQMNFQIF